MLSEFILLDKRNNPTHMSIDSQPLLHSIDPSGIGEFVKHGSCPRYAKLRYGSDGEETSRNWREAFKPLDPLLLKSGQDFEQSVYDTIESHTADKTIHDTWSDISNQSENIEVIGRLINKVSSQTGEGQNPTALAQVPLQSTIGAFSVAGEADLVLLWPTDEATVEARVFDMKASFEEKTYHQIQTSCYTQLFEDALSTGAIDDDITVTISAGIITRETDISSVTPEKLPEFNRTPRETDVTRLLRDGGELHSTFEKPLEDVEYQHDSVCRSCPYREHCYTSSVENGDIRLLNLSRSEQSMFISEGFETVADIAELIDQPEKPRPYEYDEPRIRDEYQDAARRLDEAYGVGTRLPWLAQKASALLYYLNPEHPNAHDARYAPYLLGAGDGSLPEDNPPYEQHSPSIRPGSLIRVYLNVQWDYVRDTIAMVSGVVDCDNAELPHLTFSTVPESVSENSEKAHTEEEALLRDGLDKLYKAIKLVGESAGQKEHAPIHLYFYTQQERNALMEAATRHADSLPTAAALVDLLSLRAGVDQQMVSILQTEVESRVAPLQPSTGLLPMMDNLRPYEESERVEYTDWTYTRQSDGVEIDLRSAFRAGLFDYSVPYDETRTGIDLTYDNSGSDGWYPIEGRFGATIPLEYIWAAKGIEALTPADVEDEEAAARIEVFRYADAHSKSRRITTEDIAALGERLAQSVRHIERSFAYKNSNIEKSPIQISTIESFSIEQPTLASACEDYLKLDYASNKSELTGSLQKPLKTRILSGDAVPLRITSATEEGIWLYAEAELLYDEFGFTSPESVAASTRRSGSESGGSGDWMVATPLVKTTEGYKETQTKPTNRLNSSAVTIDALDVENGTAKLSAFGRALGSADDDFLTWHKQWTIHEDEKGDSKTYLGKGAEVVLDAQVDDITSDRASYALLNPTNNETYNLLEAFREGNEDVLEPTDFIPKHLREFTDWAVNHHNPSPNTEQQEFINLGSPRVSLLQGPPGTGKTSGATALALLARLFASERNSKPCRALVTGASNKSIDEVLEDVSEALESFNETSESSLLQDVQLVRVTSNLPDEELPNVTYMDYQENYDQIENLHTRLDTSHSSQTTLSGSIGGSQPHTIVFATPTKTCGLASKMLYPTTKNAIYALEKPQWFDVIAADEASMLPLPQLLVVGHFLHQHGQLLITGDMRQMPPVHKHEWQDEDRRSITEIHPHLSTLDYFRFLRGDVVDGIDETHDSPVPIPLGQLQETYRCHADVAEFLREWIYAQDGIEYGSNKHNTLSNITTDSEAHQCALASGSPLTLVLHDDSNSQQSNPVEAAIASEILNAIPKSETTGVVTPHNAQKGRITNATDRGLVDTVERFQGGQRSVMVLSATVSDPDYLDSEADFLLSPNRLNVAMSRMKKGLVVVAPRTLFEMIPEDVETYENSMLWKGLYETVGATEEADWSGTLQEFCESTRPERPKTHIEIYTN